MTKDFWDPARRRREALRCAVHGVGATPEATDALVGAVDVGRAKAPLRDHATWNPWHVARAIGPRIAATRGAFLTRAIGEHNCATPSRPLMFVGRSSVPIHASAVPEGLEIVKLYVRHGSARIELFSLSVHDSAVYVGGGLLVDGRAWS
eukprot:CAMPEP_0180422516 /NCGR_PEP_ID=MMETSP1036_2-20121128/3717_1 /TAXON_ID=632150 /ORGANISM="Azadinium spinosum, Strain 3D9" /LENGTH=148 /DNA_ID=CAMNT_0022427835 /DNA_START=112 /DNA_END=560 /DNA_ORIENTATION=-